MRKVILFILIVTVISCGEQYSRFKRSRNIPRKKFVTMLAEIHVMQVMSGRYEFFHKYSANDSIDFYSYIIEKYGYTRQDFDSTVAAYSRRPELYEKVYNEVLMKLHFMLDTLKKNDPEHKEKDLN